MLASPGKARYRGGRKNVERRPTMHPKPAARIIFVALLAAADLARAGLTG